jgi:hypothetical protein
MESQSPTVSLGDHWLAKLATIASRNIDARGKIRCSKLWALADNPRQRVWCMNQPTPIQHAFEKAFRLVEAAAVLK